MSLTQTSIDSAQPLAIEDLAQNVLALARDLRRGTGCEEGLFYHYFQAIAYHMDEHGGQPSERSLSTMFRSEMEILADGGIAEESDYGRSKWKTDSPEESHVLERLLSHRVQIGHLNMVSSESHYDPNARPPKAEKVLDALGEKLQVVDGAEAQLKLLIRYIPQLREQAEFYAAVAQKHGLPIVRSEREWLADKEIEELLDLEECPIDISEALSNYRLNAALSAIIWAIQTGVGAGFATQLHGFLGDLPDILFADARALASELESLAAERADFEAWLLGRAGEGIFRTDVMAEIDRRWDGREIAKRAGRSTLERLETEGHIHRSKKLGKLLFMRAA